MRVDNRDTRKRVTRYRVEDRSMRVLLQTRDQLSSGKIDK